MTKVNTNKYEIIFSQSFNLYEEDGNRSINIELDNPNLNFNFIFLNDSPKGSYIEWSAENNKAVIKVYNFINQLGMASQGPTEIASDDSKKIYFTIYGLNVNQCLHLTVTILRDK